MGESSQSSEAPSAQRSTRSAKPRAARPQAANTRRPVVFVMISLLAALVLMVVYYYVYVRAQERYFTDRNFRALSVLGQQVDGTLDALESSFRNAAKANDPKKQIALIGKLTYSVGDASAPPCEAPNERPPLLVQLSPPEIVQSSGGQRSAPGTEEQAITHETSSVLWFCHYGSPSPSPSVAPTPATPSPSPAPTETPAPIRAKTDLSALLDPLIAGSALDNVDVFVADNLGRIVFERGRSGLRLTEFPTLRDPKQNDGKKDNAKPDGLPAIEDLLRSALLSSVPLGQVEYKLFTQPIRLSVEARGPRAAAATKRPTPAATESPSVGAPDAPPWSASTWVVGAVVPADQFNRETQAISFTVLSVVPLLVLVALLVLPALKLWAMGHRDRLTAIDVHILSICVVVATALVTVLARDWYAYRWLRQSADAEMKEFGGKLDGALEAEIQRANRILEQFTSQRQDALKAPPPPSFRSCTDILSGGTCVQRIAAGGADAPSGRPGNVSFEDYPYFEMLFLAKAEGAQVEKWSVRTATTPPADMTGYSSFLDPKAGRLLDFGDGRRVALNLVTSPNTADTLVVLSRPVEYSDDQGAAQTGVAFMVPDLISLVQPVAPPGFSFAVIENDGRVLFHSNPRRRLYENFFAETDGEGTLRSAIFAARPDFDDIRYHGRAQRAYLQPLKHTPWSLIVLRDKEMLRTLNLEIVATCVFMFALLVPAYVLALILMHLCWPDDHGGWIWPDPDHPERYCQCAVVLLLVALWLGWAIHHSDSVGTAAASLTALLFSMTLVFVKLSRIDKLHHLTRTRRNLAYLVVIVAGGGALATSVLSLDTAGGLGMGAILLAAYFVAVDAWDTRLNFALMRLTSAKGAVLACGYVSMGLALLLVVAVLPSSALFTDAFRQGMETLVRLRELELAEALALRAARIKTQYSGVDHGGVSSGRLLNGWDVPSQSVFCFKPGPDDSTDRPADCSDTEVPSTPLRDALRPVRHLLLPHACREQALDAPCSKESGQASSGYQPFDLCRVVARHLTSLITAALPVYDDESAHLREMIYDRASDCRWHTKPEKTGALKLSLWLQDDGFGTDSAGGSGPVTGTKKVSAYIPRLPMPPPLIWVGVLVLVCATAWLVWVLACTIFGLHLQDTEAEHNYSPYPAPKLRFYLRPSNGCIEALPKGAEWIDLRGAVDPSTLGTSLPWDPARRVVVAHFEYRIDEKEWNDAKLELLEELVFKRGNPVDITSEVDLLGYFSRRVQSRWDKANEENYMTVGEMDRWAAVLASFVKIRTELPERTDPRPHDLLAEECQWTERLREIESAMRVDPPHSAVLTAIHGATSRWDKLSPKELIRHLADMAEAHYRVLWSSCTDEEWLVLIHLATEGFVNPRNWETVRRLMRRHLIRRTPALRLMNESFRRFVLSVEPPDRIREWEHAEGPSSWERVRGSLVSLLVVGGVFLFFTQPDVLTKWLAFLGAIAAGAGSLTQLLGLFQGGKTSAPRGE